MILYVKYLELIQQHAALSADLCSHLNPYKPGILFMGHRQTE